MAQSTADAAQELVEQVIDLNTGGDLRPAISRRRIFQTLKGSGFTPEDVDDALVALQEQGVVVEQAGDYRLAED